MPARSLLTEALTAEHVSVLLALYAGAPPENVANDLRLGLDTVMAHVELAGGVAWLTRGQARRPLDAHSPNNQAVFSR
jgi:hypothetical protein